MTYRRKLAIPLLLAISACGERDPHCADLFGGGTYCLQPSTAVAAFEAQQKVDLWIDGRRDTLIVEFEVDGAGLRLVGLTPLGHKIVQLNYDNRAVTATTLPADSRLSPALLVAMLQLALWPAEAVRAGLEAPLTLEEGADRRRILNRGEPAVTIERTGSQPPYRRLQFAVQGAAIELSIETLSAVPEASAPQ